MVTLISNEIALNCYVISEPEINLFENVYGAEFTVRKEDENEWMNNNVYSCLAIGGYAEFIDKFVSKNNKILIKGFLNVKICIDENEQVHETKHLYITYISLCKEKNENYMSNDEKCSIIE